MDPYSYIEVIAQAENWERLELDQTLKMAKPMRRCFRVRTTPSIWKKKEKKNDDKADSKLR